MESPGKGSDDDLGVTLRWPEDHTWGPATSPSRRRVRRRRALPPASGTGGTDDLASPANVSSGKADAPSRPTVEDLAASVERLEKSVAELAESNRRKGARGTSALAAAVQHATQAVEASARELTETRGKLEAVLEQVSGRESRTQENVERLAAEIEKLRRTMSTSRRRPLRANDETSAIVKAVVEAMNKQTSETATRKRRSRQS